MFLKKFTRIGLLFYSFCISPSLCSGQAIIRFPNGDSFFLELPSEATAARVGEFLEEVFGLPEGKMILASERGVVSPREKIDPACECEFWVHFISEEDPESEYLPKKTYAGYRKYHLAVTEAEKKDIRFIMKTLSQKSLTSLWGYKTQLENAGDRIDHIHPLRFLECIFSDDELKVYIHNIRKRGSWVWGEFIKGFKDSLQEEAEIGNLKDEYLNDFVSHIGIEIGLIYNIVKARKWEDLIKTLIINVPRDGDSGRYDQ